MLKIDIVSGFLGAGKTTFIKRLLDTKLNKEKVVLIENEYGEVSVDSDLLGESQIEIKELSQGCICCSLVGDFAQALNEVISKYNPDRILIEPSGVGKLSDVIKAVADAELAGYINSLVCMVDAKKAKMYDKNFGEFFVDQIENAQTVILSRMDISKEETAKTALEIIRKHNPNCVVITTPIKDLSDDDLLKAYEGFDITLLDDYETGYVIPHECACGCGEHHHHHEHDENCTCGCHDHHVHEECHEHHHHHEHDENCTCGCHDHHEHEECHEHHHHHEHDENCTCGCHDHHEHEECHEHHHHHEHDENCTCGCHDHHHHHHHADEIFTSVGIETVKKYDIQQLKVLLDNMANGEYGQIVRAKGIVQSLEGKWYVFNLTPEEVEIEDHKAIPLSKIVVIGAHINSDEIKQLF